MGDPTFLGWFTFTAYLVAALFSWRAWKVCRLSARLSRNADAREARRQRHLATFWFGVALLMVMLGLNKQLDLQLLVGELGKAAALSQGWYEERESVRRAFIVSLVLLSAGAMTGAVLYFRDVLTRITLTLTGIALILAYVLLRAVVVHVMRGSEPAAVALIWVLELLGIVLVAWTALRRTNARQP